MKDKLKLPENDTLQNLVADIRNRRLLPVMIALLVAIVAVPFVISGPEPVDEPTVGELGSGSAALDPAGNPLSAPAVLAERPVLRDYRERLDNFKRKNPFKQQLTGPPKAVQAEIARELALEESGGGPAGAGGSSAPSGAPAASATASSAPSPLGTGSTGAPGGAAGGSGSSAPPVSDGSGGTSDPGGSGSDGQNTGSNKNGGDNDKPDGVIILSYEADVRVGPIGNIRRQNKVEQLDFLPNETTRVFQFVKSDLDGTTATFAISPDAIERDGQGECQTSKRSDCELLKLKAGQSHQFTYEPNGKVYRLVLQRIKRIERFVPADEVNSLNADRKLAGYGF